MFLVCNVLKIVERSVLTPDCLCLPCKGYSLNIKTIKRYTLLLILIYNQAAKKLMRFIKQMVPHHMPEFYPLAMKV